ncbi:MAG: single-stranded-DNA-specific exonuclease RecJ [Clostridiales bacterium]|jgi:single-stranded-DNA-specific exonuclease|nr:single-stranded-DNA-specific exonuclease RecJ [Clostridiales bacterium]
MPKSKWLLRGCAASSAELAEFSEKTGVSPVTARVLFNRGVKTVREAEDFLNPELSRLTDFTRAAGLAAALELTARAVGERRRIIIYGDYDVDGVASSAVLFKALRALGGSCACYIPDREREGYGLNEAAVRLLAAKGASLLITCDNGIAAAPEIAIAKGLGLEVIVVDHHEAGGEIPPADALIDPKQPGCPLPFKEMCAAALCYRFVAELFKFMGYDGANLLEEFLQLAAVAAVCDIVDLTGDNRIIVKNGLDSLNGALSGGGPVNAGLKALLEEKRVKKITEYEAGFIIGPCVNAAGRLARAFLALRLLTGPGGEKARQTAAELSALNERRKSMTASAAQAAVAQYEAARGAEAKVVVLYNPEIHESIAGIVAGRVKDKICRPVIVLTNAAESGFAKGSGRSVEGYDMYAGLFAHRELFTRFGGHKMAAGMTLPLPNIERLTDRLQDGCSLSCEDFAPVIRVDAPLPVSQAVYALAKELERAAPFGKGNKRPLFGAKNLLVQTLKIYESKNTIRFDFLEEGAKRAVKALCFGKLDDFAELIAENYGDYEAAKIFGGSARTADLRLDIVYNLEINEYNGSVSPEIRVKDFRLTQK